MRDVVGGDIGPGGTGGAWRGAVPLVVLVLLNLIPLAGVLVLHWELLSILILYWLESGIIGVVNIFKIIRSGEAVLSGEAGGQSGTGAPAGTWPTTTAVGQPPTSVAPPGWASGQPRSAWAAGDWQLTTRNLTARSSGCLAAFFAIHYGMFWLVHGVFVFAIPVLAGFLSNVRSGGQPTFSAIGLDGPGILIALVGLSAYHIVEYWYGFIGKGEYRRTSPAVQMMRPYARVFVLHLTILFGAVLVFTTGQQVAMVALLVGLKTIIDVGLYAFARARQATLT